MYYGSSSWKLQQCTILGLNNLVQYSLHFYSRHAIYSEGCQISVILYLCHVVHVVSISL